MLLPAKSHSPLPPHTSQTQFSFEKQKVNRFHMRTVSYFAYISRKLYCLLLLIHVFCKPQIIEKWRRSNMQTQQSKGEQCCVEKPYTLSVKQSRQKVTKFWWLQKWLQYFLPTKIFAGIFLTKLFCMARHPGKYYFLGEWWQKLYGAWKIKNFVHEISKMLGGYKRFVWVYQKKVWGYT